MSDEKYLSKLAALLRQAESTNNSHEAESYMAKAQALATSTQISLEVARQYQANKEKRETPTQKTITIGTSGKKGLKYYVRLFLAIAAQNDVRCNVAHNSSYVVAFGFPSDIEMTELLYASLVYQMIEASDKFIRSGEYKKEQMEVEIYETEYDYWEGRNRRVYAGTTVKPVDGRVARANFQEAFVSRISERLRVARKEAIAAHDAEHFSVDPMGTGETVTESVSTGTELVLANKALEVADYYKEKSNARGSWGGWSGSKGTSYTARSAGRSAGDRARIGANKAIGGSRTAIR